MVDELNEKDNSGASFLIDIRFNPSDSKIRLNALSEIIYSIGKTLKSNNAWEVFTYVANKLGTCQQYVERNIRSHPKITIHTQFGQNYIEFY